MRAFSNLPSPINLEQVFTAPKISQKSASADRRIKKNRAYVLLQIDPVHPHARCPFVKTTFTESERISSEPGIDLMSIAFVGQTLNTSSAVSTAKRIRQQFKSLVFGFTS